MNGAASSQRAPDTRPDTGRGVRGDWQGACVSGVCLM